MSKWIISTAGDINVGDYVKGTTSTNSQKHGQEYNYEIEGFLVYKDDNKLYKSKILKKNGEIVQLCSWVGTSGWNNIYKLSSSM